MLDGGLFTSLCGVKLVIMEFLYIVKNVLNNVFAFILIAYLNFGKDNEGISATFMLSASIFIVATIADLVVRVTKSYFEDLERRDKS